MNKVERLSAEDVRYFLRCHIRKKNKRERRLGVHSSAACKTAEEQQLNGSDCNLISTNFKSDNISTVCLQLVSLPPGGQKIT